MSNDIKPNSLVLATISKHDFNHTMTLIEKKKKDAIVQKLQKIPQFSGIPRLTLLRMVNASQMETVFNGRQLLSEGPILESSEE